MELPPLRLRAATRRGLSGTEGTVEGWAGTDALLDSKVCGCYRSSIARARLARRSFLPQTSRADEVQRDLLMSRIARHADRSVRSRPSLPRDPNSADFRRPVPIRAYDAMEPVTSIGSAEGDLGALFGPGHQGPDVRHDLEARPTGPRRSRSPSSRSAITARGWTIWGILAFDAHPGILQRAVCSRSCRSPATGARAVTPSRHPCWAIPGLDGHMHAESADPARPTACRAIGLAHQRYRVRVLCMALRLSVFRNLGTTIAANPSTMLAIARLGDREEGHLIRDLADGTLDPKWGGSPRRGVARPSGARSVASVSSGDGLEAIVNPDLGRLLPKDYWPDLASLPTGPAARWGLTSRNYLGFLRRSVRSGTSA